MCNCKISKCSNKRCSCFKNGNKCLDSCTCDNCQNKPDSLAVVTQEENPIMTRLSPFKSLPLTIVSWNLCNFAAIKTAFTTNTVKDNGVDRKWNEEEKNQLLWDTRESFLYLGRKSDVIILQEFTFQTSQIQLLLTWLTDFDYAVSTASHSLEHLFLWRRHRIRPLKPIIDSYVLPLIKEGLTRPLGTMRLFDIENQKTCILSSVHLKSGSGEATRQEVKHVFEEYEMAVQKRYGFKMTQEVIHILCGDFNLNLHKSKFKIPDIWNLLGSPEAQTSVGGKNFDFFLLHDPQNQSFQYIQSVLQLARPKNSRTSQIGVSDHHPVLLTIEAKS